MATKEARARAKKRYYRRNKARIAEREKARVASMSPTELERRRESRRAAVRRYTAKNKDEKARKRKEAWAAMTPEERRRVRQRINLKFNYGLSLEDYERMMLAQNGVCAICRKPCKTGWRLAVDHDHSTKRVRGLLCANCNHVLGKMNDDPALLRAAADYIERSSSLG